MRIIHKNLQFIKFSIVGVINTIISFILYYILISININYLISSILSYSIGMINSFLLNKYWVFIKKSTTHKHYFIKFIIVNIFTLSINSMLLYIFVSKFNINLLLSQFFVTLLVLMINFWGNKFWTFNIKDKLGGVSNKA
ncbi:GtrA family protein [Desulfofarcimen acetoxidans DSM 771]|uniref:GtrA family protein n=1 Tax=Desulfofarcimen acetoxidans (strain ATCC 49208 / DSM 771 / KCTC 5769 / VKM B-1644 / 5575) TaxID=485916 RepID=C8VYS9_DESAS|nr:GtrA family protein [Desulfofarcimen acetoxidans DSM 771]